MRPSAVVVGASAGGIEALKTLAAGLPPELPAAVAVVLHVSPHADSRLPEILARAGLLPVSHASDGEPLRTGHIYVAPPDRHLLLRDGRCVVTLGPRENYARPAIDPLFRSAAAEFGHRVVAVVLSGTLSDGVAGAKAVSQAGGSVIVQDPSRAVFPDLPWNAITRDHPDRVLPPEQIAAEISAQVERLTQEVAVGENE
jgi:two-component system chemotaxis response regulator CheB